MLKSTTRKASVIVGLLAVIGVSAAYTLVLRNPLELLDTEHVTITKKWWYTTTSTDSKGKVTSTEHYMVGFSNGVELEVEYYFYVQCHYGRSAVLRYYRQGVANWVDTELT